MLDRLADILNIYGKYVINEGTEPRIYHEELGLSQLQDLAIVYNPKVSATVEIPTGKIENVEPESVVVENPQSHAYKDLDDQSLDPFLERVAHSLGIYRKIRSEQMARSLKIFRQRTYHEELGPSQLGELAMLYNPKVNATVEIPSSNLETIVEPESAPDNSQSYEQGTDQTYDPNSDAPKKTIRSADDLPNQRYGEKEFRDAVLAGGVCIVCDSPAHRLQAAHIIKHEYTKNMHPTIGLPKCRNHHTAYDKGKIIIGIQDDYVVLSRVPISLPIDEIRDRIRYHLEELCEGKPEQLEEYLQLQRQYIVNAVEQQVSLVGDNAPTLEAFVQKTNHWWYHG